MNADSIKARLKNCLIEGELIRDNLAYAVLQSVQV